MMLIAAAVFVVTYAFIISDRVNKTMVALMGAGLMVPLAGDRHPRRVLLPGDRNRLELERRNAVRCNVSHSFWLGISPRGVADLIFGLILKVGVEPVHVRVSEQVGRGRL
jgi:hypothetical protein